MLFDILSRVLYLRQLHGVQLEILICLVDVKEAFRQVPVDPSGASVFGYTTGGQVVVDLRCQVGWRSSPGFWSLFPSALAHSLTRIDFQSSAISPEGAAAVDHVQIVPQGDGRTAVPLPRDCQQTMGTSGFAGSPFFVRFYVDDGGLIEGRGFSFRPTPLRACCAINRV